MRILLLLTTVLTLATSCVHTEFESVKSTDNVFTIAPKMLDSESASRASDVKSNTEYISATHKSFSDAYNIGIFATTRVDNNTSISVGADAGANHHHNSTVTMSPTGTVTSINPEAYYETRNMKMDISAYFPRVEGATPHAIVISQPAVQNPTSIKLADILYANGTANPSDNKVVPLQFKHAMALVQFTVKIPKAKDEYENPQETFVTSLNNPTVYPFKTAGTFSLANNTTTATGDAVVTTPSLLGQNTGVEWITYSYEMLVMPQSVAAGAKLFQVEVAYSDATTDTFNATLTNEITLEGSKVHKFELTANSNGGLAVTATIADWTYENVVSHTIPAQVSNTFNLTLINATTLYKSGKNHAFVAFAEVSITEPGLASKTYVLTLDGTPTSTGDLTDIDAFDFKFTGDKPGDKPASYPYTITKVDLLDENKATVLLNTCYTDFPVNSKDKKNVTLYQHTNSLTTTVSIDQWGTGSELVDKNAPIENTMYISLFNNQATDENACNLINKVKLEFKYNEGGEPKIATTTTVVDMTSQNSNAKFAAATNEAIEINKNVMTELPEGYDNLRITKVTMMTDGAEKYSVDIDEALVFRATVNLSIRENTTVPSRSPLIPIP